MGDFERFVRVLIADLFRSHAALLAKNAILRQELIVAERKIQGRVRWMPWQRFAMAIAARFTPGWRTDVPRSAGDHPALASRRCSRILEATLTTRGATTRPTWCTVRLDPIR
jgi:hypothetical protein